MAATSPRYFNVADASGPLGEDHYLQTHLIALVLRSAATSSSVRILGTDYPTCDGTHVRAYVQVEDLGRAHLLLLGAEEKAKPGEHRVYNLGNGAESSQGEVLAAKNELGLKPERADLDAMVADA